MAWWEILLCFIAGLDICINVVAFTFVVDGNWEVVPQVVNPIIIYKNVKVNWFGCFVLTLVYHIIFSPFAIGYWLYKLGWLFCKLCTIGRK